MSPERLARDRRDAALYRLIVRHRLDVLAFGDDAWLIQNSADASRLCIHRTLSIAIRRAVRALEKR